LFALAYAFWLLFEKGTHNPGKFDLFTLLWFADLPISILATIIAWGSSGLFASVGPPYRAGRFCNMGSPRNHLVVFLGCLNRSLDRAFFKKGKTGWQGANLPASTEIERI
jgi:hypothetical protein